MRVEEYMLFSSTTFLFVFLPIVLLSYYLARGKIRNIILLIASLIFYAWGEPVYVVLMLISTLADYCFGLFAYRCNIQGKHDKAKWAIVGTVVFNIGMLGFFKYTDFIIGNLNTGFGLSLELLKLPLPLGISFYSFQTMSYTIDIYRGEAKPQKNPLDLATYVVLFPQLIAGPIVRYQTVADQLIERKTDMDKFGDGVTRFITGLGKKVLLANTAGAIFTQLSELTSARNSVALAWICSIAFTFQIYFDFSGYSDMAIGLGKMFGFEFLENFNYPYISKSITEFWRRWHISLSTWFRDYVYIPLGGSRKGRWKTVRNVFIVWLLTGIWHGAAWNFVIWGLYFFILLMVEKIGFLKVLQKLPSWIQHLYTLLLINISWVIFAYDKLPALQNSIRNMFGANGLPVWNTLSSYYLISYGIILFILCIASTPFPKKCVQVFYSKINIKMLGIFECVIEPLFLIIVFVLCTASLASDSFNPFLYFRF